jgi:hypothetical protein
MTRDAFPDFEVREHYLSAVYCRNDAGEDVLLGELQKLDNKGSATQNEYKAVGRKNSIKRASSQGHDVTLSVYVDDHLRELGLLLGVERPAGGWLGTEKIALDPAKTREITIKNYDNTDEANAVLQFTEYLIHFAPASLSTGIDSGANGRVAEITGSIDDYYGTPVAG